MPNYRCQTIIITKDNVAANYSTNTTYFFADNNTVLPTIKNVIRDFYIALQTYLSPLVAQNGHQQKWYDMADPEPRAPVLETTFDLTANPAGTPLPTEASICVSYQGAKVSGQPQARRRGRFYVGPLDVTSIDTDGRVLAAAVTAWKNAAQGILTASDAATTWRWQQFSTVNDGFADVTDGWVDNEYDTQRRRGRPYTVRQTFT